MRHLFSAELFKCSRNIYVLLAFVIIIVTVPLTLLIESETSRAILCFDFFELALFFVVGSIWGLEYTEQTIKNTVMTHSKTAVFVSKTIFIYIISMFLFILYAAILMIFSDFQITDLLPQAAAYLAHTAVLILTAQIIRSFSMFSVCTIIIFFINHIFISQGSYALEHAVIKFTPVIIFVGTKEVQIPTVNLMVCLVASCMLILIGLIVFKKRDI
jgi:hypothetical protein